MKTENLREYFRKYMQEYRQKESYKEYMRKYMNENRERINKKYYGMYIYFVVDGNGEIVYVGKTTDLYHRIHNHFSQNTGKICEGDRIFYKDFKTISMEDLFDLEQMLIELLKPERNNINADYDGNVVKYLSRNLKLDEYVI